MSKFIILLDYRGSSILYFSKAKTKSGLGQRLREVGKRKLEAFARLVIDFMSYRRNKKQNKYAAPVRRKSEFENLVSCIGPIV